MPSRIWRLNAPAYRLNDAPVEFHKTLKRYLVKSEESLKLVGLRFETSKLDPCLYTVFTADSEAVGIFSTHIDDILGCGAPGVLERTRKYLEHRFGALKVQERTFVHVGMELTQVLDFSVTLTQKEFTSRLQPLETSPALWKRRQGPLSDEEKLLRQCKMGELCWLSTASRPDICARLAQLASKVNALQVIHFRGQLCKSGTDVRSGHRRQPTKFTHFTLTKQFFLVGKRALATLPQSRRGFQGLETTGELLLR